MNEEDLRQKIEEMHKDIKELKAQIGDHLERYDHEQLIWVASVHKAGKWTSRAFLSFMALVGMRAAFDLWGLVKKVLITISKAS